MGSNHLSVRPTSSESILNSHVPDRSTDGLSAAQHHVSTRKNPQQSSIVLKHMGGAPNTSGLLTRLGWRQWHDLPALGAKTDVAFNELPDNDLRAREKPRASI